MGARALRIDETLTRLTAAHAGLAIPRRDEEEQAPAPVRRSMAQRLASLSASRLLGFAVAVLIVGTTAFGWANKSLVGSTIVQVAALNAQESGIVDPAAQVGDENVLVVASDTATSQGAGATAGSIVVAHIPAGGGEVRVLSIPPDLEINRPPCEQFDPGTATYKDLKPAEARTQLSSAFEVGGPACATRVVQQLTGIAITSFVGIDLARMAAAVQTIGGVQVCVARPVLDAVLGPILPNAGAQTLDGSHAGDFLRAANVEGDPPAEIGRVVRQQQVLAAVLGGVVSTTGLLSIGKVSAVRSAMAGALMSDGAGLDEVMATSLTLSRLDADGIAFIPVPVSNESNGRSHTVLRDTDAAAVFEALHKDTPLPEGARGALEGRAGPAPADLKVAVRNASDRSGLAATVRGTLKGLGFGVGEVSNAGQPSTPTVIRFSPDQEAAAELLATTVPSAKSVPDPGTTGVLQLVLGRSFDDVIRAPADPTAAADAPSPTGPAPTRCN